MPDEILNILPLSNELWKGIGGHFDSLGQIIAEFVDNSVTNIIATSPANQTVSVHFNDFGSTVKISVEDSGSGIGNLENAFRLGGVEEKQGPLNEHGFGMKHALASANPENDNWYVCTRTRENFEAGIYKKIMSPYKIDGLQVKEIITDNEPWPGQFNGPGTIISFTCMREMFNTLRIGMPGQAGFSTCIQYLIEDLGFLYAGLIERNIATFNIRWTTNGETSRENVPAVKPSWEQFYSPGQGSDDYDLGNGKVIIKYQFGAMKESNYKKYYRRNMSSSGLEIRINGRVLAYNLFKEVWNKERHNMYNHVLVIIDIISDKPERIPPTRTSKNGFRQGDPRLEAVYNWVRRHLPNPPKEISQATNEKDLFEELKNQKKYHIPDPKTVETEQDVFATLNEKVRIDLYVAVGEKTYVYEGKKDQTTVQDVYQLKMYWDGAVLDGLTPTNGILIASNHPESVKRMVNYLNNMNDIQGNNYSFVTKTWKDEGIKYPE